MTSKLQLAYLAGVIDSDGWFSIKKSNNRARRHGDAVNYSYHPRVGIKQVRNEAVELAHSLFGGYVYEQRPTAKNGQVLVAWQVSDLQAETVVRAVLPFLRIKGRQAKLLLELRKAKAEGPQGTVENTHTSRWGSPVRFKNRCYSTEQIAEMDRLYLAVRGLNDTRHDRNHWPI